MIEEEPGRRRLDRQRRTVVAPRVVIRQHVGMDLHDVEQVILVADLLQLLELLRLRQSRVEIGLLVVEAQELFLDVRLERRLREELRRRPTTAATESALAGGVRHELVGAEGFLVEELPRAKAERRVVAPIELVGRLLVIDPDLVQELPAFDREGCDPFDVRRAAARNEQAAVDEELVPFRVAAEIVVIVEDENPGARHGALPEVVRGAEAAHPAADDDEVVDLAGVFAGFVGAAVAHAVGHFEQSRMAAAQSRPRRRVVAVVDAERRRLRRVGGRVRRRDQGRTDGDADAVEKVTARYRPVHAKITIALRHLSLHRPILGVRIAYCG